MANRLCLIDDDIFILEALALELRRHDFEVRVAPGAAAGIDIVRREGADAVVTDINMPGTNGMQLIVQIREEWPELPIIAMSGSYDESGRPLSEAALEIGASCAIAKPFRASQLLPLLQSLGLAERTPVEVAERRGLSGGSI
jgi:DNA-binding response OmpR family regulator